MKFYHVVLTFILSITLKDTEGIIMTEVFRKKCKRIEPETKQKRFKKNSVSKAMARKKLS